MQHTARQWLDALAQAWQTQDADAMASLFTEDATAQSSPYDPPVRGRDNLRQSFAWWMKDQSNIFIAIGQVDVIGDRFYAEIDSNWTVPSTGGKIRERGLLVCDMDGARVKTMREFWKRRTE